MSFLKRFQSTSNAIRRQIDDYVADEFAADGPGFALAVVADGAVVHAAGYGIADLRSGEPIEQGTIFHLASCGKQFTGLGILMLAQENKLRIDDPIGKHIPLLVGFGPRVTIRTLLHHTSGIRDLYDEEGIEQVLARCPRPTNADLIQAYADLGCPIEAEPGDAFSYSNSGYDLLGAVIEAASNQSYHDFFGRRVFDRLGMKDTFSVPEQRVDGCATGYTRGETDEFEEAGSSEIEGLVGSGSFYTTVLDLCLYEQALRTNSLLKQASMAEAFTSGRTNDGNPTNYGFGWFLGIQNGISFADHEGDWNGFRSYACYCRDRPLSVFALSNNHEADLVEVADVVFDACL